jgi:hypothetical protein
MIVDNDRGDSSNSEQLHEHTCTVKENKAPKKKGSAANTTSSGKKEEKRESGTQRARLCWHQKATDGQGAKRQKMMG